IATTCACWCIEPRPGSASVSRVFHPSERMNHLQAVKTSAPERYLLEEMSELERHAFEDHYFSCADCAEDVRLGALMREGARAGFLDAEKPVSLAGAKAARARTVWRPSVVIP